MGGGPSLPQLRWGRHLSPPVRGKRPTRCVIGLSNGARGTEYEAQAGRVARAAPGAKERRSEGARAKEGRGNRAKLAQRVIGNEGSKSMEQESDPRPKGRELNT